MKTGDKVKIKDDYHEYDSKGKWNVSWRAGAIGTFEGTENKRGTIKGIVKSGNEGAGYFYFRVNTEYIEKIS